MRIQCGCAQTGFDLFHCALGVQCGEALSQPKMYLFNECFIITSMKP